MQKTQEINHFLMNQINGRFDSLPNLTVFDLSTDNKKTSGCMQGVTALQASRGPEQVISRSIPTTRGTVSLHTDTISPFPPPAPPTSGAVIEQEPFRLSLPAP